MLGQMSSINRRSPALSPAMLQNAYVLAASGNGSIPPIPRHKQDLTRQAHCSRWSKMLHNAPALLAPVAKGVVQLEIRNKVLKQCESQDDARRAGPWKSGASGGRSSSCLNRFPLRQSRLSLLVSVAQHFVISKRLTPALPSRLWARETFGTLPGSPTDNRGNRS
jgi:hypothetical protein